MKSSILKSVFIFAAGAGCASVVAQGDWNPRRTTIEEFQLNANKLLAAVADAGIYVVQVEKGRIVINPEACPPPNPRPKKPAVHAGLLNQGTNMLVALNKAYLDGNETPIFADDRCQTE